MKALILAAGVGSRISKYTDGKPKCLLKIDNKSILEHQLVKLNKLGISCKDIFIVTGYKSEQIERVGGNQISYIYNDKYKSTNSLYSMWLAREYLLNNEMILLNADVVFHEKILSKLIIEQNAVAVDFNKNLESGEMNVIIDNNQNIIEISKTVGPKRGDGESVQIAKFNKEGANILFSKSDELIKKDINNTFFPAYVFKYIIDKIGLKAVDVKNLPWGEIDYFKDFERAEKQEWK
tara:strand:+ start:22 stop:729 length:708 start_codon:yes stop_codon:yes gene_type:complete